jgi:hypothetical protein
MSLSFHTAKKIIEKVVNAMREAYKNLCGQLISHYFSKESYVS